MVRKLDVFTSETATDFGFGDVRQLRKFIKQQHIDLRWDKNLNALHQRINLIRQGQPDAKSSINISIYIFRNFQPSYLMTQ
jgi:hypothetical protein